MDFLTHLFLPTTAAYVLWRDRFSSPWYLSLAGAGLLSDLDKFLGVPGLLHSALTVIPLCLLLLGLERALRGELDVAPLVVFLVLSHLVLDFVDGGPVPFLYPVVEQGLGLQYPVRTVFGVPPFGLQFEGAFVTLQSSTPRPGHNTYGFVDGAGVASALLFATVYFGSESETH